MAANDAYYLQGLNGADIVTAAQTFNGYSRGALILEGGDVQIDVLKPDGATTASIVLSAATAGQFIGGQVISVAVTSGMVEVFPESVDYTIA